MHAHAHPHARQKAEAADKWHEPASRHALAEQTAVTKVGAVNDPMIRRSIHAATSQSIFLNYTVPDLSPRGGERLALLAVFRHPAHAHTHTHTLPTLLRPSPPALLAPACLPPQQGVLRMGQEVEVRPGVVTKDASGAIRCMPIRSRIVSLFAEQNPLQFAVPGGLIGVGTTVDPTLTRADRLVGQVRGAGEGGWWGEEAGGGRRHACSGAGRAVCSNAWSALSACGATTARPVGLPLPIADQAPLSTLPPPSPPQVLGEVGALPDVFTELEINFFLLRRLLGVRTSGDEKQGKVRGGGRGERG